MDVEIIRNFFNKNLNVTLQEEWLTEVVTYLNSLGFNSDSLLSAVYEQWLYTDLKISTKPLLSLSVDNCSTRKVLGSNTVIQINSIIDIGASLCSQYRNLTKKFEDNSGFQLKLEENETNSDSSQNMKRMLSMEVTDGQLSMKAIEYSPLNALSLLTCPGCKILLKNNVCFRRGILLLTEVNCIVLGGDDDLLMKTGRPVEVIMMRLNIGTSLQRQNFMSLTKIGKEMKHNDIPNANNVFFSQSNMKPVMEVKPLSGEISLSETPRRKVITASGTPRTEQSVNSIWNRINVSLNESPSCSDSRTPVASISKRPMNLSSHNAHAKHIKMEVVDDDVIVLGMSASVKEITGKDSSGKTNLPATPKLIDDPVIAAYKRLGIESISAALRTMRFAVGSKRKILAAIMETKPLEPLHVNNDKLWALTVALSDESYECLKCVASHKFLVELIGWTPEEAIDARASKDRARRKEGSLRTKSAAQAMRRLDLIWEVEFFPSGGLTPIIHKIDTYAQKFGLIR
ncbi:unnamed protein product [Onchocerca flexuosa]|uniref:RecQ-mediated genome instability protein 1 n=1 Tax=Onchocerca flexuosa TaxID=387005 RepID=A0A183I0U9_9BILA|nr:unnamed protein product [Onchocerca flexuosa]